MKKVENECTGCKDLGLYCIGNSCPYKNTTRFYCDKCGEEGKLYHYDEYTELCADCLLEEFEVVDGSDD